MSVSCVERGIDAGTLTLSAAHRHAPADRPQRASDQPNSSQIRFNSRTANKAECKTSLVVSDHRFICVLGQADPRSRITSIIGLMALVRQFFA
jgi:hypothetical protein